MNEEPSDASDTNTSFTSSMLSRSGQILQAVSPYIDENTKKSLENIVHVTDFLETMQTFRQNGLSSLSGLFRRQPANGDTVSMANLSTQAAALDTESILRSIRPLCTKREGEMIDRIMSMLTMMKFLRMYQSMQSMMSAMNTTNDANQQNNNAKATTPNSAENFNDTNSYYDTYWNGDNYNDSEYLRASSQSESNQNTASYDNYNNYNEYGDSTDNGSNSYSSDYDPNNNTNNYGYNNDNANYGYNNGYQQEAENYNYNNNNPNYSYNNSNDTSNASNNTTASTANNTNTNSNFVNKQMLDMLSTIIPPEQKNTFDAMKLLMETGVLK